MFHRSPLRRFGDIPEPVMNLIGIAHLRGVCGSLGVTKVNAVSGTLIFRLNPDLIPDPQRLYQALVQTDPRLMFSAARDSAILFRAPGSTAEEMLRAAVPVMEKVSAAVGNATDAP